MKEINLITRNSK